MVKREKYQRRYWQERKVKFCIWNEHAKECNWKIQMYLVKVIKSDIHEITATKIGLLNALVLMCNFGVLGQTRKSSYLSFFFFHEIILVGTAFKELFWDRKNIAMNSKYSVYQFGENEK